MSVQPPTRRLAVLVPVFVCEDVSAKHSRHLSQYRKSSYCPKSIRRKRIKYTVSHLLAYYFSLFLIAGIAIVIQASPTSPVDTLSAYEEAKNISSYDTKGNRPNIFLIEQSTSTQVDGEERARLAKMHESDTPHLQALTRDIYHWRTHDSPEFATMVGLNDNSAGRLDSFTPDHYSRRKTQCEAFLVRAGELDPKALNFEDRVNLQILQHHLSTYTNNFKHMRSYAPITLLEGPHLSFPRLVQEQMVLTSYDDFQKLLSRYGEFPRQVQELIALLQDNVDQGFVPPALALEGVLEQLASFAVSVTGSQFFKPFVDLPEIISSAQRRTLRQQAQERVAQDVLPAYHGLHQYMQNTYMIASRSTASLGSIEGGSELYAAALRYHTATSLTPTQIHELGLAEMKRIHPLLIQAVASAALPVPEGNISLVNLMESVRNEPGRYFDSPDEMVVAVEDALLQGMRANTDPPIDIVPQSELRVRGSAVLPLSSRVLYEAASLDASRLAVVTVDTSDVTLVSRDEVTALSLYAGMPGRHLLAEYLRTTTGVPTYRRVLGDVRYNDAPAKLAVFSSFVEGWALYGQFLGEELGLYKNPRQRLGRVCVEVVQAALMVVDTGVHQLGWTQDAANTFLLHNTPLSPAAAQSELRRVMTWPGLASAAKVGEIKLKELRQKALNALGELFRLRDFHRVVLKCAGPISLLQVCVDHYIDSVTNKDAAARSQSEQQELLDNQTIAVDDTLASENVPPDNSAHTLFNIGFMGHYYNCCLYCMYLLVMLLMSRPIV